MTFIPPSQAPSAYDPNGYSYVTIGAQGGMTYLGPVPQTLVQPTVVDNTAFDINIDTAKIPAFEESQLQMGMLSNPLPRARRSRSRSVESSSSDCPRRHATRSKSRNRSVGRLSDLSRERSQERSASDVSATSMASISKRDLITNALTTFSDRFGPNYDQNGNRGENVLRIKVKTRTALEHIVPFVTLLDNAGLLTKISCPISTKKGRQHIRGFLAYLETTNTGEVKRLFTEYNESHATEAGLPFKDIEENPPSKRPYNGPVA